MRLIIWVLALLLSAAPGFAQAPGKPGFGGGKPETEQPGVCNVQQRQLIEQAFRDALAMTRLSIQRLDREPNLPEFRRWFGTAPVQTVRGNLVLIANHMATQRPPALFCNPPNACPQGRFAFVMTGSGGMGFCPLFFNARNDGFDSRPGIVVHEISHVAARTRDIVYSPSRAATLAKDDPMSAAINADNYEYFVETTGAGALR
ncbi:MAG: M35 family metallopeptidase [Alphaproteobacteria bacterium]|nr:M35 family metallopeptidase [Alphaproteobacteria bacterium]